MPSSLPFPLGVLHYRLRVRVVLLISLSALLMYARGPSAAPEKEELENEVSVLSQNGLPAIGDQN